MSEEQPADMLARLGSDGFLWAQEFNKTAVRLGYSEMDEGWLIGWFANAIENSCNPLRNECERLRKENARLREALVPFAGVFLFPDDLGFEHSEDIRSDPDWDDDANDMQSEDVFVLRRDVRRARAAIREGGKDA